MANDNNYATTTGCMMTELMKAIEATENLTERDTHELIEVLRERAIRMSRQTYAIRESIRASQTLNLAGRW